MAEGAAAVTGEPEWMVGDGVRVLRYESLNQARERHELTARPPFSDAFQGATPGTEVSGQAVGAGRSTHLPRR